MVKTVSITTAEQLAAAGDLGRCELIRGELIMMTPAGDRHGDAGMWLAAELAVYIKRQKLGRVYLAETGFILTRNPDTVRAPDFAFISNLRWAVQKRPLRGFREGSPDLVMEVLSPDDGADYVAQKVRDWVDGGCLVVVVVDPRSRTLALHRPGQTAQILTINDELRLEPILPGFVLPVREAFPDDGD